MSPLWPRYKNGVKTWNYPTTARRFRPLDGTERLWTLLLSGCHRLTGEYFFIHGTEKSTNDGYTNDTTIFIFHLKLLNYEPLLRFSFINPEHLAFLSFMFHFQTFSKFSNLV